ncbi:uncharacterized protein [Prorops nasuta]|uniref:uncharacterized protein n=1 Tax=Prorops nasuta TaxID=863751 RepID=UPI0034D01D0E
MSWPDFLMLRELLTMNVSKGLPQGGVLSPLLYLLYVSDIDKNLDKNIIMSQFADDIAVFISVTKPYETKKTLETSIKSINSKLRHLGLSISPSKSVFLHFNRKNIKPECLKRLNILKFVAGIGWGAEPNTLLILFKSLIRSIIKYNSFIFFPKRQQEASTIERIQYAAIRTAYSYRISTPTNILLDEAKCPAFFFRTKFLGCKFVSHSFSNNSSLFTNLTKKLISEPGWDVFLTKSHTMLPTCIDQIKPYESIIKSNNKIGPYLLPYKALTTLTNLNSTLVPILRNGSKNHSSELVGAACFSPELNIQRSIGLNQHMSSFSAECIAIGLALKMAIEKGCVENYIFSDCLSALQALSDVSFGSGTNPYLLECKSLASEIISQSHNLELIWIPSHSGISLNESIDTLSKSASKLPKETLTTTQSQLVTSPQFLKATYPDQTTITFLIPCIESKSLMIPLVLVGTQNKTLIIAFGNVQN